MTREEAIVHIKDVICENNSIKPNIVVFEQEKEALYMAIKALGQEPCEDAISRQAVLEIFGCVMSYWKEHAIDVEPHEIEDAILEQYEFTAKELSELPPVTPKPKTDVLNKIRAEIEECKQYRGMTGNPVIDKHNVGLDKYYDLGLEKAIKIIDKYKEESENNE